MDYQISIIHTGKIKKVDQVVEAIRNDIEKGMLTAGIQLPSITTFAKIQKISRDTVEKAYKRLREDGYIHSEPNKGYFIQTLKPQQINILLVMNKISAYKKEIYEGLMEGLGDKAKVQLEIHQYSPERLKTILKDNQGKFHYYAIMPHFFLGTTQKEIDETLSLIPASSLILLDKDLPKTKAAMRIYQDFEGDIFEGLKQASNQLKKYNKIEVIYPAESHHPKEILKGIQKFCKGSGDTYTERSKSSDIKPKKQTVYITLRDSDLAILVKAIRNTDLKLGTDVGILSFNETVLKDLLGITVVTTDFTEMGRLAAEMIIDKQLTSVNNPFFLIQRTSL